MFSTSWGKKEPIQVIANNGFQKSTITPIRSFFTPYTSGRYLPWDSNCTWNPLDKNVSLVLSNNNLTATNPAIVDWFPGRATVSHSAGMWRFQVIVGTITSSYHVGLSTVDTSLATGAIQGATSTGWEFRSGAGIITSYHSGSTGNSLGNALIAGDVVDLYIDLDNGTMCAAVNGVAKGIVFSSGITGALFPCVSMAGVSNVMTVNFGGTPFIYSDVY